MYHAIILTDITDSILGGIALGAYKCAHVLRKNGFSCLVINHLSTWSTVELKSLLNDAIGPETYLLGISSTFLRGAIYDSDGLVMDTTNLINSFFPQGNEFEREILSHIRDKNPKIKVCIGGPQVDMHARNTHIDYILMGYSEISIVNLMRHLVYGESLERSFRDIWGKIVIDDRKAESYDFTNSTMEWLEEDVVNHQVLPFEVARGCIFKCKFCSYPMNGKQQLDFVRHTDLLAEELQRNYDQFGITRYLIVDDTFNDHNEKLNAIREMVRSLDFQPIFWAYNRLDLICTRPETLGILYDIGLRGMYFGIETLHSTTGRIIGKGFDRNKQIEMMHHIKDHYPEISMHGSFITGLPHEPIESVQTTFDQIHSRHIPVHSWMIRPLSIYRRNDLAFTSEIIQDPTKFGYEILEDRSVNSRHLYWRNEHMDLDQARQMTADFMSKSKTMPEYFLSAEASMALSSIGLDFDNLRRTAWKDVDYHDIRSNHKAKFEKEYRKRLHELVRHRSTSK